MADGGKGSARRPGSIPDGAWDRIFNRSTSMTEPKEPPKPEELRKLRELIDAPLLGKDEQTPLCAPTDDGPGQDGAVEGGEP